eukprot:scaffold6665_cov78-Skeletonema_dohrnii-CCMP3373.AAC.6
MACCNEDVTEGIIRCLLDHFPAAISDACDDGELPLHTACGESKNMTRGIIQLLIDAAPAFVRHEDNNGLMPLHHLCSNRKVDKKSGIKILKLLLQKYPESIRHAENKGRLPIHVASIMSKPSEFCRVLIEAYPGSEQIGVNDLLPLHFACMNNTAATVEYFYGLYPDAINHETRKGMYPIHLAICGLSTQAEAAVDIVKILLECDPNVILQKVAGALPPLVWALMLKHKDTNIGAALEAIEIMYDAHPEAIEDDNFLASFQPFHQQIRAFCTSQLVYSRQARDHRLMTTPDDNGQLPLHTALQSNVRLGSIKLLVKGNPPAVQSTDNSGSLPLHIACAHYDSASVVQFLIGLDATTLDAVDHDNNTALHYACRGAKYETIAMLLDHYDSISVSKRNTQKKLPIDLLWESNQVEDRESIEYTESVFRLLKAYPEMMMNWMRT